MTAPPAFASLDAFRQSLTDPHFWRPYLEDCLGRHGLLEPGQGPVAGVGGTYPTFLWGGVVVKLFGFARHWRRAHDAEQAILSALAADPDIAAPRLLADGVLCEDEQAPWPYLVASRIAGVPWQDAAPDPDQRVVLARDLGRQLGRVHALAPSGVLVHEDWPDDGMGQALARSSLPPHLAAQADAFLSGLGPFDRAFVHGDVMFRHVFVEDGRLSGLIDWGDAMVTDRRYELAKLHLDLFDCEKPLLRAFLAAADWPAGPGFARMAMAMALYRQAHGVAQHHTMDVFYKVPELFPLRSFETLEELGEALFGL